MNIDNPTTPGGKHLSYYAALPAAPLSPVTVRIYEREIEILDALGQLLRRHEIAPRRGTFTMDASDRLFNPSRETARLLRNAERIGPHTAAFVQHLFARLGEEFHDLDDVRYLLRYLNVTTVEEALTIVLRYFDAQHVRPKTRLALEEILSG